MLNRHLICTNIKLSL